jgi:hypothetical protein
MNVLAPPNARVVGRAGDAVGTLERIVGFDVAAAEVPADEVKVDDRRARRSAAGRRDQFGAVADTVVIAAAVEARPARLAGVAAAHAHVVRAISERLDRSLPTGRVDLARLVVDLG